MGDMERGPPAQGQGAGLLPRPPKEPVGIKEGEKIVFSIITEFMKKRLVYYIIRTRSPRYTTRIEFISSTAILRISLDEQQDRLETITIELVAGEKKDKVVDAVKMRVRSNGMLGIIWEDMMWYKYDLHSKYCYDHRKKQGQIVLEYYSIDACYPPEYEDDE